MAPLYAAEREAPVVSFGDHHLDPLGQSAEQAPVEPLGLSGDSGGGALRDKPLGGEPPQHDEQLPGERDHEYLAHAPARLPEPLPEPFSKSAARLIPEATDMRQSV